MEFFTYFLPIFKAVLVIFIIGLASGILLRKGVLNDEHIKALSHITVILLLPCLTFAKIIQYFKPEEFTYWWMLPLLAIFMISLGLGLASLFYLRKLKEKRSFIAIAGFMNANYMVLPIGQLVFADQFDEFAAYTFLFVMGVIPMLWSVGKFMVTSDENSQFSFKALLNPMFITTIFAVLLVLTSVSKFIPKIVLLPIDFIGQAAIPSATLILGATLGSIALKKMPHFVDVIKVISTKLLIMPVITIFVLLQTNIAQAYPLIADMLVIQASVAPATQIILQVKKYGGKVQEVGSMMLIAYVFCLVTIPFWFSVWNMAK
ncbi:MAG: AEC family transporter [Salinivirgaceae bacterium]|jgi:predicted permease|nr:AEC family transporter [Salinivirgaceae bacterium]